MSRRVVITGVGAVTPLGVGARRLLERWRDGESGIEDGLGRCREFDPSDVMSTKEARRTDRFTQLAWPPPARRSSRPAGATACPMNPTRVGLHDRHRHRRPQHDRGRARRAARQRRASGSRR